MSDPTQPATDPMGGLATGPVPGYAAPPRKCLFGVTILLIEDSRAASEALRLFAAESGARVRRADSLASAARHLAIYRPNVVIVDLGLPDGSGLDLIRALAAAEVPYGAIVATSGQELASWERAAREAGAAACLEKPIAGLRAFQICLLALLPDRGTAPAEGEFAVAGAESVRAALRIDLERALVLLEAALADGDAETVRYCAQFIATLDGEGIEGDLLASARSAAETVPGAGARLLAALTTELAGRGQRMRGAA